MLFVSPYNLFSFSSYLNFYLDFLVMQKIFIRKIRLILKFITPQPWKQTIAIHILSNIPRSKDNQIMKTGKLIEYNTRNIFLEKSYVKCNGETIPRPVSKKIQIENISWINSLKFYAICVCCMPIWGLSKYFETKLQTLAFTPYKGFLKKQQEVSN